MIRKRSFSVLLIVMTICNSAIAQFSPNQEDLAITSKEKSEIIDTIITTVNGSYIFPDIALQVEKVIRERQKKGAYNKITSSKEFADTISNQLVQISNDKHLRILFSYDTVPQRTEKEPPLPDFIETFAIEHNYGFDKIDILEGNIGYLNILGFFPFDEATNKAIASLGFLSNTQALIIDLRKNTGGVGTLANFVLSYFYDQRPFHFLDVMYRKENRVEQSWSSFYVPGKRFIDKPVYVLTSKGTFSAGEAFAYILQSSKRATIIGEVTGGGANVGDLIRINEHFVMNLPVGRPVSPITNSNWEGTGIKPDIDVAQENALTTAHAAALKELIQISKDEKVKGQLKAILIRVQATVK